MGLNIDILTDVGYLGASYLGDVVCGMDATRITSKDFLFWFRSHTATAGLRYHWSALQTNVRGISTR
jgi:hypothetical protein